MTPNDPTPAGDANLARLLDQASELPPVPPEFARRVRARLLDEAAAAARRRRADAPMPSLPFHRLAAVAGVAALLGCLALGLPSVPRAPQGSERARGPRQAGNPSAGWLTAAPRPKAGQAAVLKPGAELATRAGQRRRVMLADGSVLFLNHDTTLHYDGERHVTLKQGEVFVEVLPRKEATGRATFTVQTPQREVRALGTKFLVRADAAGTGVTVTQGKVQVGDAGQMVRAGQHLAPGAAGAEAAPRVSHLLDWTRDLVAEAAGPLVPRNPHAGGALVAVDPQGQEANLSLRKYHIDVHVEDGFARTTIDQTYFNHYTGRLEGTFYFPLPPDASLSRLAMYVDGNLMEGGMVERDYGRAVFEQIVSRQKDPALLEWVDGSTFKMRVFPLEGRQEKRIVLSYTQKLPTLYGRTSYRFPSGHNLQAVREWSFRARVKGGAGLGWQSDSHVLAGRTEGADLVLSASARDVLLDRDVLLELYDRALPRSDFARFRSAAQDGARYLMVRYRPELPAGPRRQRRDWVFLVETSGERDPLLARTQIEIVRTLLANVEHGDTFAVLTAGTRVRALSPEPMPVTPDNVAAALEFLERAHLVGALDLEKGLRAAEPLLLRGPNSYLIHLGSGQPVLGERGAGALAGHIPEGTRYVGVGVGKRWGRALMKRLAEGSDGYFTQINPDEPVAWRAFDLLATLNTPRLLGAKVEDAAGKVTFLTDTALVAQGEELFAVARLEGKGAVPPESVTVRGTVDGRPFRRVLAVKGVTAGADYLPRTWAKLEIERLLAAGTQKNKQRVVELSKAMYVMTPFTSLLVLENEAMYKQYNVDRGRKDHWAMYPCPQKIPVVHEPLDGPARTGKPGERPTPADVLRTVVYRDAGPTPPRPNPPNVWVDWRYPPGYMGSIPDGTSNTVMIGMADGSVRALGLYNFYMGTPYGQGRFNPYSLTYNPYGQPGPQQQGQGLSPVINIRGLGLQGQGLDSMLNAGNEQLRKQLMSEREAQIRLIQENNDLRGEALAARMLRDSRMDWNKKLVQQLRDAQDDPIINTNEGLGKGNTLTPFRQLARQLSGRPQDWALRWDPITGTPIINPVTVRTNNESLAGGFILPGSRVDVLWVPAGKKNEESRIILENMLALSVDMGREDNPVTLAATADEAERLAVAARTGEVRLILRAWQDDNVARMRGANRRGIAWPFYRRPTLSEDAMLFRDLVAFAPGLNTTAADVRAVLEDEANMGAEMRPGRIDAAARALIDRARAADWLSVTVPAGGGRPAFAIVCDGRGRYRYERTLDSGLRELVVSDGGTLLHLYPEIGLGARRQVTRPHRADFRGLVPWALPPAADLARGADVCAVDERTVAVVSRWGCVQLVFGKDGRLMERQLFDKRGGTLLARETYDADGTVRYFDGPGKETIVRHFVVRPARRPDLEPDLKDLVVLPLPFRTYNHLAHQCKLDDPKGLGGQPPDIAIRKLSADDALALIAARLAEGKGQTKDLITLRFFLDNDRRLGFFTLMLADGISLNSWTPDLKDRPLERYLKRADGLEAVSVADLKRTPLGHFLPRMTVLHALHRAWRGDAAPTLPERQLTLRFIEECPSPTFAWVAVDLVLGGNKPGTHLDDFKRRVLEAACKRLAGVPGLEYPARYEYAAHLQKVGEGARARELFVELYEKALAAGVLPPIDERFRDALGTPAERRRFLRGVARCLMDRKRPDAVLGLAGQCAALGDAALVEEFFNLATRGRKDRGRYAPVLAEFLGQLEQNDLAEEADRLLDKMLGDADLAGRPVLWRSGEGLAAKCDRPELAMRRLERALELEDATDTAARDYARLLAHYEKRAEALALLGQKPEKDLAGRVVQLTDRWRRLSPDGKDACAAAGRILRLLGERELAWEYLTTPLGRPEVESGAWRGLARDQAAAREHELADRAFAVASALDPGNAEVVWERARNLWRAGRRPAARTLFRRLAEGAWDKQYEAVRERARMVLRRTGP